MKKILSQLLLVFLFNMLILQNAVFATNILIPSGTPVAVYLENKIDADEISENDTIDFIVQDNVRINNKIVIKSGTNVTGQIIKKRNNFILGLPGEVQVGNFSLIAEDNQQIYLRGIMQNKGTGREWANIGWFFLFPLLFIKGDDGKIEAGRYQIMYTVNDVILNVK